MQHPLPMSVVTGALSNPIKRGVATALRWMNPKFAFWQPHQFGDALKHLQLENAWPQVRAIYQELQKQVPAVTSLEMVMKAMEAHRQPGDSAHP